MTGILDKDGLLKIEREGVMIEMCCPFGNTPNVQGEHGVFWTHQATKRCGDWCPLFSEPLNTSGSDIPEKVTLQLCNGKTLTFDTFADDRLMREAKI